MHTEMQEENGSKYPLQSRFKPKVGKTTYTERRKAYWFLIIGKIYVFLKSKCFKRKTTYVHCIQNSYKSTSGS